MRKPTGKAGSTAVKKTATKKRTAKKASKKAASKPRIAKKTASKKATAKRSASKKAAAPKGAKKPTGARAAPPLGCCTIAYMDGRSESRNGYTEENCRKLGISGGAISATHWQKGVCA